MKQVVNAQTKSEIYAKIDKAQKKLIKFEEAVVKSETEDDFPDHAFKNDHYTSKKSDFYLQFDGQEGWKQDLDSIEAIHMVICEQYRRQMQNYIQSLQNDLSKMINVEI